MLWDIDGTLIWSGGAGEEALRLALLNDYGIIDDLSSVEIAGRTDRLIARDVVKTFALGGPEQEEQYLEGYLQRLPDLLPKHEG
ncbi:MAG: hydrolase, partial [Verrucomicrobiae bacterium]|nr:hydrolase [Verrucomicrobiae bacterium]